jgi:transposase-like protein
VGGDVLDRGENRLQRRDAVRLGAAGGAGPGPRDGKTSETWERLKALGRENRAGSRQVNEILRKASAYFAQAELDRRFKP